MNITAAKRIVIVASSNGSVMNRLLSVDTFRRQIHSVVSDRQCLALTKAAAHGVNCHIIQERDKVRFCEKLLEYLETNQVDYMISFFSKLYVGRLLEVYQDRIINLHPSLLPAFKGLDGFGDAINYGVQFVGSTIHFIDEQMDAGKIIMQTVCPVDRNADIVHTRHRIFQQQCKSLLQVVRWLEEDRVTVHDGRVRIKNSVFTDIEYSPSLDFDEALQLNIPLPAKA